MCVECRRSIAFKRQIVIGCQDRDKVAIFWQSFCKTKESNPVWLNVFPDLRIVRVHFPIQCLHSHQFLPNFSNVYA